MSEKTNRFCFTRNNYTDMDVALLKSDLTNTFKYWCFGKEIGECGTPHLQGYFEFHNSSKLRISAAQKRLYEIGLSGYSIRAAKGTAEQNINYCSKDGDFHEGGERPKGQGKRTDLDNVCDLIKSGKNMSDIANTYPAQVIKFHRGIQFLMNTMMNQRNFKTEIWWLWGPTGSGKSRYVWELYPCSYMKVSSHKWWDGYIGQDVVIMDDFRPSKEMPFNFILNLFDRYPLSVETKGGMIPFVSKIIYVTSPYSPDQVCAHLDWLGVEEKNQLMRRIDHIVQFPQIGAMMMNS